MAAGGPGFRLIRGLCTRCLVDMRAKAGPLGSGPEPPSLRQCWRWPVARGPGGAGGGVLDSTPIYGRGGHDGHGSRLVTFGDPGGCWGVADAQLEGRAAGSCLGPVDDDYRRLVSRLCELRGCRRAGKALVGLRLARDAMALVARAGRAEARAGGGFRRRGWWPRFVGPRHLDEVDGVFSHRRRRVAKDRVISTVDPDAPATGQQKTLRTRVF